VVVGIPAYNEAMRIGSVVLAASRYADEVVVVDDGSTDETATVAREAGATVLSHGHNRGKGRAIASVLEYVDPAAIDAVVLLDGDGQHCPTDIPTVLDPVMAGESDLVVGSRYMDATAGETPLYRRLGQTVLDVLTNRLSGADVSDTQSGFRALSPRAVAELDITTDGMGVESEMVLSAVESGLVVTEAPIEVRYSDVDGHSRHPLAHGLTVMGVLARSVGHRYPLLALGLPGVTLAMAGGLTGVDTVMTHPLSTFPWQLGLSVLALALGAVLVACGMLWHRGDRLHQRLSGPR
jgi:hypothetical protein